MTCTSRTTAILHYKLTPCLPRAKEFVYSRGISPDPSRGSLRLDPGARTVKFLLCRVDVTFDESMAQRDNSLRTYHQRREGGQLSALPACSQRDASLRRSRDQAALAWGALLCMHCGRRLGVCARGLGPVCAIAGRHGRVSSAPVPPGGSAVEFNTSGRWEV